MHAFSPSSPTAHFAVSSSWSFSRPSSVATTSSSRWTLYSAASYLINRGREGGRELVGAQTPDRVSKVGVAGRGGDQGMHTEEGRCSREEDGAAVWSSPVRTTAYTPVWPPQQSKTPCLEVLVFSLEFKRHCRHARRRPRRGPANGEGASAASCAGSVLMRAGQHCC